MSSNGIAKTDDKAMNQDDVIDLGRYLMVIKRYKWKILGLALVFTLLVALIVLSMTPIYKASSSLLIEAEEAKVVSIEEVYGLDSTGKEYFQTQYEILKSRHIAEKVVDKLDLTNSPYFASEEDEGGIKDFLEGAKATIKSLLTFLPQSEKEVLTQEEIDWINKQKVIESFMESMTVSPVNNTQVVKISFESESPKLAAKIADTTAEVYIESYLEAKFDMTSKATTWLNDSLQGLRLKLERSEQRLAEFYEKEQLVDLDGVVGLAAEELQGLSEQLLEAENRLKNSEIIYQQVQNYAGDIDEIAKLPEVLNHPSIQSVRESELTAQSKVSELSKVYGPKHQKMISAMAELNSVKESMNRQVRALISGITSDYGQATSQVAGLRKAVADAKAQYRKLTTLDSQRKILQREVSINQQLYDSFFTRLKETSEVGGFESANARILDRATIPVYPAKPKTTLIVLAAFVLSLGFGVFIAVIMDVLNSGIRSVEDVERKLGQRMMGLIPWQPHKKKEDLPLREFFDPAHHTFSEAIRTLRTSVQLIDIETTKQVIMVTSSVPKEGKTTVSINMAFAMGQLGKTILVDTDMRRPSVAKRFDFPGFQPGLSNLLAGTHRLDECLVSDAEAGIDVISAGSIPTNPQEMLASNKFKDLITELKTVYDYIIIDTAPTQAVSDSIVVSKVCDVVLYVVRADNTKEQLINSGLNRFMSTGKRVDGIVLNQVDLQKSSNAYAYTGYYDKYGYNSHYADGKDS
ncbi:GumC family protein [Alteromonas gilva]|uniref:non-specific protein-tyrosine kinase n=1 Tax=Alteromonas gilva TaxID=2987522 RepID=A0ABT5KXS2_9ALTE|nr:polysaccharide biosynthesis tyrosine autokinase [Alteromonas gilva]MDC8829565.1 polysaccharide biosynthesis tyrosine autokinase [Alteromonas gilva]